MKSIFKLFLLILILNISLSACNTGSNANTLTAADAGKTIEMSTGETFAVELEGNPTTGYAWEVDEINPAVLKQVGEPEFKAESDLVGAEGIVILHFEAIASGDTPLKLIYHRPWEEDVPPLEIFEVGILVK